MSETIQVKVITRAKRNHVEQLADGVYKIWTTAVPEKGKANQKVVALLAEQLDVPKSEIHIIKGVGSTNKQIIIGDYEPTRKN